MNDSMTYSNITHGVNHSTQLNVTGSISAPTDSAITSFSSDANKLILVSQMPSVATVIVEGTNHGHSAAKVVLCAAFWSQQLTVTFNLCDFDAETSGGNGRYSNGCCSKLEAQMVAILTSLEVHMFSCVSTTDTRNGILVGDGESISVTLTRFTHAVGCRRNSLKIQILISQINAGVSTLSLPVVYP